MAAGVAFYEGLIRLLDETGRVIPARDFIGVVEDQDLGRRSIAWPCGWGCSALHDHPGLRLSVNMSARSVGFPDWMQILRRTIRHRPETVRRLILEITETSAMHDARAGDRLHGGDAGQGHSFRAR
jgi:EAL domain-containing protein (putative c-di-GMP-specific phosphodiesterase class I)